MNNIENEKEVLKLYELSRTFYYISGKIPIHKNLADPYIHFELISNELLLKALLTYYNINYAPTHNIKKDTINILYSKINVKEDVKEAIKMYNKFAKKLLSCSRYGEMGIDYYNPKVKEIQNMTSVLRNFIYLHFQPMLEKRRKEFIRKEIERKKKEGINIKESDIQCFF